jgi:ADP-L-glycero-D-manno-heptose 6-epimerase
MRSSPFSGRILVTGGAGFIGSALVWALNQRGVDNILIADFLGSGPKWRNLNPLRFADYVEADRLRANLDKLADVSLVLHLGACSSTTESDVAYLMDNNYAWTRELAGWAVERGIRFVYASSAATYGDGSQGMADGDAPLDGLRPLNPYGYSKHLFDLQARRLGWLDHIVGLKYFNVFGPNEDHKGEMRSLVHKAFGQIKSEGRVRLFRSYRPEFADGEQQRDFLYVKDAVEMTLHLAGCGATGLYNIGSGVSSTWLELARSLFAALDLPEAVEFVDMPEELRSRYQYFTRADLSRLRARGYSAPPISLRAGVQDYVKTYLVPDRRLGDEGLVDIL